MSRELNTNTGPRDLLRRRRVLIVDDNPGDRFLYKQMLIEADPGTQYDFEEVETGALALERLAKREADCILLDYLLPDILGIELLAALEQSHGAMPPVVMLTGFGDETTAVSALQAGAHGYIPKRELTGAALSRAIDRAVRAASSQRMLERSRQEMAERNSELEQKYRQIVGFYRKILGRLQLPVRALRDHLTVIEKEHGAAAERQAAAEIRGLRAESEQLVLTLGNLIDNPGINLGQLLISTHPASIIDVISDTVNAFRPAADAAGVRLTVQAQAGLPEVQVDRYRIEQTLANLLDNAIRHTPKRGQISLKVNRFPETPQELTIAVSDTGPGIPADRLARLNGRCALQGPAAEDEPSGCGLHVCSEIIRAHKGRISVQSQPGAGTCVTFTLPLEQGPAQAREVWEQAERRLNGGSWRSREADRATTRPSPV
jgi:signal transduction histidine kinase